jgi:hypothetical protein
MTVERDVGSGSVQRAKDARAFVSDFTIEKACRIKPASPLGIGCKLHLLMRGDVDLGISVDVVIGAADAGTTEAARQGVASIRHGPIEDDAVRRTKTEVIRAQVTIGRTAKPAEQGGSTDELVQRRVDEERVVNTGLPALHAHRVHDFMLDIGILEEGSEWVGRGIHEGACELGVCGSTAIRLGVLLVVCVQPGVPAISEVTLDEFVYVELTNEPVGSQKMA